MRCIRCACALQLWPHRKYYLLWTGSRALKPSKSGLMSPYEASSTRWIQWTPCAPRISGSWQRISPCPPQWVDTGWCHCLVKDSGKPKARGKHPGTTSRQIKLINRMESPMGRTIRRETIIQQPGALAWGWLEGVKESPTSNLRSNTVYDLLDDPSQEYNQQGSATCRLIECEDQNLTDQRSWTFQKPLRS